MKVLFAVTKGEVGGAQEHIRILATGLLGRGADVTLLTEPRSHLAEQLGPAGATVIEWSHITRNPHPVRDPLARAELREVVIANEPDVLHVHSTKAGVLGRGLTSRTPTATVFTCHHAPYGPGRQWSHRLAARPVEQLTLRLVDGIISVGARDVPLLAKIAPAVPIEVIRNAIEVPPIALGAPLGTPVALWVARLKYPKRVDVAVRAWEGVVRERGDARLIICGTGPQEEATRALVSRSGARDNIEVLGFVDSLDAEYSRSSLFLLSSMAEGGLTMATLEAMSHGLSPVVSDVGDAWLLLVERAGYVARPRDPASHARAVLRALEDPDAAGVRERALSYASNGWSTKDMVNATALFYESLTRKKRDGRRGRT